MDCFHIWQLLKWTELLNMRLTLWPTFVENRSWCRKPHPKCHSWFLGMLYPVMSWATSIYSQLWISRSCGDYFLQVQITRSANQFALQVIWTCKKSLQCQIMVGESNQYVLLIQIDASSFAEFEISELEIARVDWIWISECGRILVRIIYKVYQRL